MAINQNNLIQRIDYLLNVALQVNDDSAYYERCRIGAELTYGTLHLLEIIYGPQSQKCQTFRKETEKAQSDYATIQASKGVLNTIKNELTLGLVGDIERQAQGGVFGDFITLARKSLDESKDVAAVLVSAALEDTLKRFAQQHGLDVSESEMAQVINALKSKGLLKDPQASIVQGHANLRNKAFHANWERIEKESVNSAIGFAEQFILSNFS